MKDTNNIAASDAHMEDYRAIYDAAQGLMGQRGSLAQLCRETIAEGTEALEGLYKFAMAQDEGREAKVWPTIQATLARAGKESGTVPHWGRGKDKGRVSLGKPKAGKSSKSSKAVGTGLDADQEAKFVIAYLAECERPDVLTACLNRILQAAPARHREEFMRLLKAA